MSFSESTRRTEGNIVFRMPPDLSWDCHTGKINEKVIAVPKRRNTRLPKYGHTLTHLPVSWASITCIHSELCLSRPHSDAVLPLLSWWPGSALFQQAIHRTVTLSAEWPLTAFVH